MCNSNTQRKKKNFLSFLNHSHVSYISCIYPTIFLFNCLLLHIKSRIYEDKRDKKEREKKRERCYHHFYLFFFFYYLFIHCSWVYLSMLMIIWGRERENYVIFITSSFFVLFHNGVEIKITKKATFLLKKKKRNPSFYQMFGE